MGGSGVLKWLHGPRSEATSVRSAVAVYPNCSRHTTLTIPMPILILLGGRTIGYQQVAAEASWQAILKFLAPPD